MAQIKRETATLCTVSDLLGGSFVRTEGWAPSYFATSLGNISRANVLGVIVSKDSEGMVLDDGTGTILLRSFENNTFSSVEVGSVVVAIGRPRVYNEEKYLMPEIVKATDPAWAEFRKTQMSLMHRTEAPVAEKRIIVNEPVHPAANYFQKIFQFIRDLDTGEGASLDEVATRSGVPDAPVMIRKLIEEGEIFEFRPGKLKILE